MATGDYCTLGELKARLWPDDVTPDNNDDVILASIITSVSRLIDGYCGCRFYTTTSDETRYFTAVDADVLFPDVDIVSVTGLTTDGDGDRTYEDTWAATDYDLLPYNASLDGRPYSRMEITPDGNYSFPLTPKGVKLVGKFGWSSTPASVREACLLQSVRVYKRRDAPFGVISNPVGGEMRLLAKLDPDMEILLAAYRRVL